MSLSLGLLLWSRAGGGGGWPPTITSSDGDPASLFDNGNDTLDVIVDGVTVGTITRAQVESGGFIEVAPPVVGMSGNNVVLTTTGYVIHVGSTPIETDVEVLADGVVVGTALPFDVTAYPDALLEVRFSFSVGVNSTSITTQARAAVLKRVAFNDGYVGLAVGATPAWPVAQRTRQMTAVFRVEGTVGSVDGSPNIGTIVLASGSGLQINPFGGSSSTRYRIEIGALGASARFNAIADGTRRISIMAAIDLDAGLPSGRTFVVWASINEGAWAQIGSSTATGAATQLMSALMFNSNTSGSVAGGVVSLHNHIWFANQAIDPAANWPNFFNSDGTVKSLGGSGIVGGVTPVIYSVGNDFATGANRGSGGTLLMARNLPVVSNL